MRSTVRSAAAVAGIGLLVVSAAVAAEPSGARPPHHVEALSWLSGDWQMADGPMQVEESWSRAAGGSMLGTGRTLASGRTVFFEYLRIEEREDGVYYVAQPKGRCPATDFKLVRLEKLEAVFEDPGHDFPKRILYRREPDGSLTTRTEGDGTEAEKPQEFRFRPRSR